MKSDHVALVLIAFLKACISVAAIVSAYLTVRDGNSGWGWMLFVAVVASAGSYKFD